MSWFYRRVLRPVLFTQESELAHNRTLAFLGLASRSRVAGEFIGACLRVPRLPVNVLGLNFPNPVGLAAGMDKRAVAVPLWRALGFGFSELGGVTWRAQSGNLAPRMFRVPEEEALVNRMGFNNDGAAAMAVQLENWRDRGAWPDHPVGINLGKSKATPLAEAAADYLGSFVALRPWADFFVVNVSSPNTPNLRQLQDRGALDEILAALQQHNFASSTPKPLLVKVAPDLSSEALDEIVDVAFNRKLAGIVATNTTVTRPATGSPKSLEIYREAGGLSGRPLRERSTAVVRHLYQQTRGRLVLVGVGGVSNAADAWEKVTAGASLVQIYSGLVFQGPGVVREIVTGLRERLGGAQWQEVVGSAA